MHSVIKNSVYARLSGCPATPSRRAASIRDCQPAPVDLKYSTTSDDKRMAVGVLVVSAFGLPGLRTTFADAKKFCTCAGSLGSYRSVSGSYVIGASVAASRCTRSQSVFEFFFKPGVVSLKKVPEFYSRFTCKAPQIGYSLSLASIQPQLRLKIAAGGRV